MVKRIGASALMLGLVLAGPAGVQGGQSATDRATATELPTFALLGFPITPVQVQVVGSAHLQEMVPAPTLTLGCMPASPHQLAVLGFTIRSCDAFRPLGEASPSRLMRSSLAPLPR